MNTQSLTAFGSTAGKEGIMIKRNYKDSLFNSLFGNSREALELYNALNGTEYHDETELEITTLENAMYLGYKNDVSFLLEDELNLYEHQSTLNPNMPLRGLFYLSAEYQKIVNAGKLNIYGTSRLELPFPKFVVLCNAADITKEREVLKLSALYNKKGEPCLECTAEVININMNHNMGILEKSQTLKGYAELVHKDRTYRESGMDEREAAELAVNECIEEGILKDYLVKYKSEVIGMLLEEYNAEEQRNLDRRDAKAEGKAEGIEEGKAKGKAEGKAEAILDLLSELGDVPDDIRKKVLAEKDEAKLKDMLFAASRASSFEEFAQNG